MSWEQFLVNAQVSVNRAVFEMNRPGMQPPVKAKMRPSYILKEIEAAIGDLKQVKKILIKKK